MFAYQLHRRSSPYESEWQREREDAPDKTLKLLNGRSLSELQMTIDDDCKWQACDNYTCLYHCDKTGDPTAEDPTRKIKRMAEEIKGIACE